MSSDKQRMIICLMGPTAAGKTGLAMELAKQYPFEIISVDSAMVYRGMDIGTAKPNEAEQRVAPHRLIDMLDPAEPYSAGQFRVDALHEIEAVLARGNVPLLVGGTMLYFHVLQKGLTTLPTADGELRATLQARANNEGWPALHEQLARVDPNAAKRIHENDRQRIQRALEVYLLTGKSMTDWQASGTNALSGYRVHQFALAPTDRARLHERIGMRFQQMLRLGFMEEVKRLYERGDLTDALPSMRSIGYRQAWEHLSGAYGYDEMCDRILAATRQSGKHQLTWLRAWPKVMWLDSDAPDQAKIILNQL
ncbi:MAG: tRNA (adenosine(37)-N6)-dimethylallyltransferase MiaA [Gammaproteobacteria bacterium RIFCSPHIGHO2_12_FULL_45_12]|nr:MAG: tRNA (adenosine(37)-N6)-dimethylallyltransferase MiaA [Gammaproteobacteria bacterium RIFCSPHIGHO2_12_FULL_45_12]